MAKSTLTIASLTNENGASITLAPLSTAPSNPITNALYLDDGTNTASGNVGWRRYTGSAWEDVSNSSLIATSTADVTNPPTDAELDSAFGTPATVGNGFHALLDDNGADTNVYAVYSNGTSWFYSTLTKAT